MAYLLVQSTLLAWTLLAWTSWCLLLRADSSRHLQSYVVANLISWHLLARVKSSRSFCGQLIWFRLNGNISNISSLDKGAVWKKHCVFPHGLISFNPIPNSRWQNAHLQMSRLLREWKQALARSAGLIKFTLHWACPPLIWSRAECVWPEGGIQCCSCRIGPHPEGCRWRWSSCQKPLELSPSPQPPPPPPSQGPLKTGLTVARRNLCTPILHLSPPSSPWMRKSTSGGRSEFGERKTRWSVSAIDILIQFPACLDLAPTGKLLLGRAFLFQTPGFHQLAGVVFTCPRLSCAMWVSIAGPAPGSCCKPTTAELYVSNNDN